MLPRPCRWQGEPPRLTELARTPAAQLAWGEGGASRANRGQRAWEIKSTSQTDTEGRGVEIFFNVRASVCTYVNKVSICSSLKKKKNGVLWVRSEPRVEQGWTNKAKTGGVKRKRFDG